MVGIGPRCHKGPGMTRLGTRLKSVRSSRLAGDTLWALGGSLASLAMSLVSFIVVSKAIGTEGFGIYTAMFALATPLGAVSFSGLVLAVMQHIGRDKEPAASVAGSVLTWALGLGAASVVVGTAIATVVIPNLPLAYVAIFLTGEVVMAGTLYILASVAQALDSFRDATMIRLLSPACRLAVLVTLVAFDVATIKSVIIGAFGASLISLGAANALLVRRHMKARPGPADRRHLGNGLLYSTAMVAGGLIAGGDKLVLSARGDADLGTYGAAYRVFMFLTIPIESLVTSSHLRFLEHDATARGQHTRRAARFGLVGVAYAVCIVIVVYFAAPVVGIVFGDEFRDSVDFLRRLAPVLILMAPTTFAFNGLIGLGRARLRALLLVGISVLGMGIYVVFINLWKVSGAIASTYLIEFLLMVSAWVSLILCQRSHNNSVDDLAADSESSLR